MANAKAKRGHSKEKRSDCPLVTLALVLDGQGFPKRSETFEGNVSEPKTLAALLARLSRSRRGSGATVVLDAGLATEENIAWLREQSYRYLVVSRSPKKVFDDEEATLIKEDGKVRIRAQRVFDPVPHRTRHRPDPAIHSSQQHFVGAPLPHAGLHVPVSDTKLRDLEVGEEGCDLKNRQCAEVCCSAQSFLEIYRILDFSRT
jgi:hypothetical protein